MTTSPRARGVRALAHQLSTATRTHIEASYEGPRDGPWGGWQLSWSGGPDAQEMRALARTCPIAQPDGAALEGVRFERSPGSEQQTASALLAWLASHPDQGDRLPYLDDDELPGHPDRLDAATRYRAATLVTAGWRYRCAGPAGLQTPSDRQSDDQDVHEANRPEHGHASPDRRDPLVDELCVAGARQ